MHRPETAGLGAMYVVREGVPAGYRNRHADGRRPRAVVVGRADVA
ncbi:hypothetical protein AB0C61_35210 [Streptomyces sp. NPDC048680]